MNKAILIFLLSLTFSAIGLAQGFLHTSGKYIYNGAGDEVILYGLGTGNWLLQEGYMMQSTGVADAMYQYREKLIETIGEARTAIFYESWLNNHFTRQDVDSLKAWGFNSVRVAMHYKWLTLPIEDEPVAGQDTWLEEGFVRLDSLLAWCSDKQLYLILDLHGAPGGQGHESSISDYDPSRPSLWESAENRRKTVALWGKLAGRYAMEPWIGGYDILNEPNWELPGGRMLKQLYMDITNAIRAVDTNHIIIVEGNWFGNDYTGLTPPWDDNMVYSFHKYWTYNTTESLAWILTLRNAFNIPIWLGESGENSNSWFTDLIALCAQNRIGWSWWPVKKAGINNVLRVHESEAYTNLMNYWKYGTPLLTADQAFEAVMEWADRHRIENCTVQYDVIDAMLRQPFTDTTQPFKLHKPQQYIAASDYDLGRSSSAYYDADTADYHGETNTFTAWNYGWAYRNDGVDIAPSVDNHAGSNGYYVGWTHDGEWMEYTVNTGNEAAWTINIRSASNNRPEPGKLRFSINGTDISPQHSLPFTSGWQIWANTSLDHVIIPAGKNKLRLTFEKGGSNLGFFSLSDSVEVTSVPFRALSAETSVSGEYIILTLNKAITSMNATPVDFELLVDGSSKVIDEISVHPGNQMKLLLWLQQPIIFTARQSKLSFNGYSVMANSELLEHFNFMDVNIKVPPRKWIPGLIQAEDFDVNVGFRLENCQDIGGGYNLAFANDGDYVDYNVYVSQAGSYIIDFRVASFLSNGRVSVRLLDGEGYSTLGNIGFASTGGWQNWSNQATTVNLPAGNQILRLYSLAGEYNLNWFDIAQINALPEDELQNSVELFPNPTDGKIHISSSLSSLNIGHLRIFNVQGELLLERQNLRCPCVLTLPAELPNGLYFLEIITTTACSLHKILKFK